MFALVRDLATGRDVTEIAVDPETVQRHHLGPLTARAGVARLRSELARSTIAWARIERDLPPVVNALYESGIRVAAIKGVSYATRIYSLPAERPMTDVDLMVPPAEERRAREVLRALGFQYEAGAPLHHASVWSRGELVIDLHRWFIGAGRARVDLDAVWARTGEGWPAGASRLDPGDELVFHLVHMARNRLCGPLVHVVDTARMLARGPGIANEALARARAWDLAPSAQIALRFCADIIAGAPHAGGWLGPSAGDIVALRQPNRLRKLAFDVATAGSPSRMVARVLGYIATRMPSRSS